MAFSTETANAGEKQRKAGLKREDICMDDFMETTDKQANFPFTIETGVWKMQCVLQGKNW